MPFYTGLKSNDRDNAEGRSKKQRVASTLNKLQSVIADHLAESGSQSGQRNSVKIATWNLREFGGSKYKRRDFDSCFTFLRRWSEIPYYQEEV